MVKQGLFQTAPVFIWQAAADNSLLQRIMLVGIIKTVRTFVSGLQCQTYNKGDRFVEYSADKLKKGVTACVKALACTGAVRRRLIDMGITPGAEIRMLKKAPFGDPIEFELRGYTLSLRKSEASLILVTQGEGTACR